LDGQQQATGAAAAGSVTTVHVRGRVGVAADAGAALINVTVTEPAAPGYITVFPCGSAPPTASNLNYATGSTIANLVAAPVGADGTFCIFTQSAAHLIVDVDGFFPAISTFTSVSPARLLETRAGHPTVDKQSAGAGATGIGTVTRVHVAGRGGVPANASTAVLNVTVTNPAAPGYVTVYPCGITPPLASNLNFVAGQTIANAVLVKIGDGGGDVCLFASQSTDLIADVTGFFR
jgi:hypothetical protein